MIYGKRSSQNGKTIILQVHMYTKELRLEAVRIVTDVGLSVDEASMRIYLKAIIGGTIRPIIDIQLPPSD